MISPASVLRTRTLGLLLLSLQPLYSTAVFAQAERVLKNCGGNVKKCSDRHHSHPIAGTTLDAHGQRMGHQRQRSIGVVQLEAPGHAQRRHLLAAAQDARPVAGKFGEQHIQAHALGWQNPAQPGLGQKPISLAWRAHTLAIHPGLPPRRHRDW